MCSVSDEENFSFAPFSERVILHERPGANIGGNPKGVREKVSGSLCPSLAGRYQRKAVLHKFHNIGMKMAKLFNHQRSISCSPPSVA
jgi:hypothetical protein